MSRRPTSTLTEETKNLKSDVRLFYRGMPVPLNKDVVLRKAFRNYGVKSVNCNVDKAYAIVEFHDKVYFS
jgi:hypothetical protein